MVTGTVTLPAGVTQPTPGSTCGSDSYQCITDGKCIKKTLLCNFNDDCSDGSDEKNCGPCDFESGDMCGLVNTGSGRYVS